MCSREGACAPSSPRRASHFAQSAVLAVVVCHGRLVLVLVRKGAPTATPAAGAPRLLQSACARGLASIGLPVGLLRWRGWRHIPSLAHSPADPGHRMSVPRKPERQPRAALGHVPCPARGSPRQRPAGRSAQPHGWGALPLQAWGGCRCARSAATPCKPQHAALSCHVHAIPSGQRCTCGTSWRRAGGAMPAAPAGGLLLQHLPPAVAGRRPGWRGAARGRGAAGC